MYLFHDVWKRAIVKVLPRKADQLVRPVSILPTLSKIEIAVELYHIESNSLFPATQSGFPKNHSCSIFSFAGLY